MAALSETLRTVRHVLDYVVVGIIVAVVAVSVDGQGAGIGLYVLDDGHGHRRRVFPMAAYDDSEEIIVDFLLEHGGEIVIVQQRSGFEFSIVAIHEGGEARLDRARLAGAVVTVMECLVEEADVPVRMVRDAYVVKSI